MDQRIHIITGKGGVGKSVVAMAMAQRLASEGRKTLLVELGDHSYFSLAFGFKPQYDPLPIAPNLFHGLWSGESCLREYIRHLIPVRAVADLFFDNTVMRSFVRAAPGLKELAILGKLTSGVREWGPPMSFQDIVLDAYATGHFLALLRAPKGMGDLIQRGPMGTESRRIVEVLNSQKFTKYHIVCLPEELPVSESLELLTDIENATGITPNLICNRYYEFSGALHAEISAQSDPRGSETFIGYIKELENSQDLAFKKLENIKNLKRLPFVMRTDSRAVIDELRTKVDVQWE